MNWLDLKKLTKKEKIKYIAVIVSAIIVTWLIIVFIRYKNEQPDILGNIIEYNIKVEEYRSIAVRYEQMQENTLNNDEEFPSIIEYDKLPETVSFVWYAGRKISLNKISELLENIDADTAVLKDAVLYLEQKTNLEHAILAYNDAVTNYNTAAEEYETILKNTSVHNIEGIISSVNKKTVIAEEIDFSDYVKNVEFYQQIIQNTNIIEDETKELLYSLLIAQQITNPSKDWIIDRLQQVDNIINIQAVTENNDPNKMLNKEGGYTACIYFSVPQIDQNEVSGRTIVEKGTDAGGAVEVYKTSADASARCDYLSQFDNTLLYSGSYALVGTNVIRTSYLLTNEQQIELTNAITSELTAIR